MTTQTTKTIKCNHLFCTLPARAYSNYPAAYKVVQTFPNGHVRTTFACESDFAEMQKVIGPDAVVTKL